MKDKVYWIIFNRLKKKYPTWSKKRVGTIATKLRYRNKTVIRGEREMKKKRHYDRDCLFYFKHAKDEWVDVYEVYGYEEIEGEEEVRHSWCLPSLEAARQIVSDFKTRDVLADLGIRELQCYVDGAGLIWVKYVHYVPID